MKKVIIALGGNALGNNPQEQKQLVIATADKIVRLLKRNYKVIVGHGNGPQVGMIYNAFAAANDIDKAPHLPLPEAGAMSQGYIGFHLLTALSNEIRNQQLDVPVAYFLTQTLVDKDDPRFEEPSKPIGPFYATMEQAQLANPDSTIIEDAGRGYRKVVASPLPTGFLGFQAIEHAVAGNALVVVGGGGGIPTIIDENDEYLGVDGVIDKDFALSKLATLLKADKFIILTAVSQVYINFNQPNQQALSKVTTSELEEHIASGMFAAGSMLPKIEAAINFVNENPKAHAYIGALEELDAILAESTGTKITK